MKISFSLVTYNNEKDIESILNEVKKLALLDFDIYVIDNASKDSTTKIIEDNFSWVKLIKSKKNLGFGAGHNVVLNRITSKYHFVINPDIYLTPENFNKIIDFLENNQQVGLVCPKILNIDGTEQFLPKRNPKVKYLIGGLFEKHGKVFSDLRNEYTMKKNLTNETTNIEFCSGCFMAFRTKVLQEVGGFDERFFMYFEDADLSRRISKISNVKYLPTSEVIHGWKRESRKSIKLFFFSLFSSIKYFWKWKNEKD